MLKPGDFLGEGALAGQPVRIATAAAAAPATLLVIGLKEMIRVLHDEHAFSDRFIAYMVGRNIRIEEDLIDQLLPIPARNAWRGLSCCWPDTETMKSRNSFFPKYRRRRWRKWWAPRGYASTFS